MLTFIVVIAILVVGSRHYRHWHTTGDPVSRRKTYAWGWALLGAILGSFTGLAGFGGAIIGTIPGAVLGWLVGSNLNKRDYDSESATPETSRSYSSENSHRHESPSSRDLEVHVIDWSDKPAHGEKPDSLAGDLKSTFMLFAGVFVIAGVIFVIERW
jgi:hypothetical protein